SGCRAVDARRSPGSSARPTATRPSIAPFATKSAVNRMEAAAFLCHDGRMRTVLIVDDHPSFRATARTLLEEEGFQVVGEAADGVSAVAAVERLQPEVDRLDRKSTRLNASHVASSYAVFC